MPSPVTEASIQLDYPVYAVDFDPQDANRIVVGGGGGADRSGVRNKIVRMTFLVLRSRHEEKNS